MAYLVFVISAQFQLVASSAGVDTAALTFGAVGWGVVVALGLFASIALHEFGHALTAQSMGIEVKGITLMMLGGVSQMARIPEQRFGEFRMAVIGPIVSFGIAAVCWGIYSGVANPDVRFFTFWLANANLVLAIFNLLPAFPMDGGRALRSLLAARHGMVRATQISVRVSRFLAFALGILGLLSFNILLMLIAFFIYSAGQGELMMLLSERALEGMRVQELMARIPPVYSSSSLGEAAQKMIEQRTTVLPVRTFGGDPQLVQFAAIRRVPKDLWPETQVKDVLEKPQKVLNAEDPAGPAMRELAAGSGQALPVVSGTEIIGLLRYADVREFLQFKVLEDELAARDGDDRAA